MGSGSDVKDEENGISFHIKPFHNDPRPEAK